VIELFLHVHLLAAIAWIGGSVFMFVLGVTLRDKTQQKQVYPSIGPIFGYFELVSLIILLISGIALIGEFNLIELIFSEDDTKVVHLIRLKLWMVLFVIIATAVHFVIALKTNGKERTPMQNFLSRGSSMFIFFVNLAILHYAIVIRTILG
jgi:uncharacterized membrane protein